MYTTVGILSSYISHVSGPFHPFGGAVDIIVVEQQDGTFKSTPWYVKFGKFQGVLKHREKIVAVGVNDINAAFHMHLDHKGEAYFLEDASQSEVEQPFSPPSGPSSGDEEAQETLAIDYPKSDSDSGDEQDQPDLQFACEDYSEVQPGASLFANSALTSIQKVAEEDGGAAEVHEEEEVAAASASFTSKNGEYMLNSYEVTQVVDDSYVVKEAEVEIRELEKQSSSELEKQVSGSVSCEEQGFSDEAASTRVKPTVDQEKAWTEVITKAAAALHEEPPEKKASNVERRTWGWWVWRGSGGSTVKKPELNNTKKVAEKLKVEEVVEDSESGGNTATRSRSMLGMMFGGGGNGGGKEQVKDINAESVVELLDNRWTVGSKGKSMNGATFLVENGGVEQGEASKEEEGSVSEAGNERSITNNVDLSTAEVVLMSVDGHVVVATQDGSSSGGGCVTEERFSRLVTAPISVPGKRILELTDSGELKVGSESTLDTSPQHRRDFGRLSTSLSSYFVEKEGKTSAAADADAASEFPAAAAAADMDDAVEKASMDVQVGSPWSTVSAPAAAATEEALKTAEEPGKEFPKNPGFELSLCRHLLKTGMGVEEAARVFDEHKLTATSYTSSASLMGNEALVVRVGGKYYPSGVAASILFGLLAFGQLIPPKDGEPIRVEASESKALVVKPDARAATAGGWRFWPFAFRRPKPSEAGKVVSGDALLVATEAALHNSIATGLIRNGYYRRSWKLKQRTLIPTSDQLASLNLQPGRNKITFTFTTRVLGQQQVDARIYLWKWNTRVVISDVDGTITKSDVLGQFMPLVGRDWTQTGVTRLFSAIKDNGYELMFLSARAISQAYLTRQFLKNLKQDGEPLPDGPVVISPDGLFPSLYREVIRRAPHEFKIACLEDIKSLFPSECQPFYAGFGNRDTDEISYLKVGIPKGKIFIINPKGEVIVNNILDMRSYTSLHKLVNDMFPPVNLAEREDFNSWNYWKMPIPSIDD